MPATVHTGIMGAATGVPGRIKAWMGVRTLEDLEATGFGSTERQRAVGLGDFVGKIVAYVTSGTAGDTFATALNSRTSSAFLLTSNTGCTFAFNAFVTEFEFSEIDVEGKKAQIVTYTFKKDGALTITWATT